MSGRLKRRSSILPAGNRRDSFSLAPEPLTQDATVDEEAERRARNLQRKQQQLNDHLDSPATSQEKGGHRRSLGGLSGLTPSQLAEHYNNCIKLSAENKISVKNAFNLQLIDYMSTMIKKKESDMSNFQVAAGTLDASTKIYAYRVDAVYGDTLKIASGLGQSAKQTDDSNNQTVMDDDDQTGENNQEKKSRKRIKRSATVEKNVKNLNVAKFELEFDVDPLFKKTSSQFDGASGGNQFLSTLEIRDETCELMLDSEATFDSNIRDRSPTKGSVGGGRCEILALPPLEACLVCPTFSQFSFTRWSLDAENDDEYNRLNESITASQEERTREQLQQQTEHAFDAFAVPEPLGDDQGYDDDMGGADGYDPEDDQMTEISERALGHVGRSAPCFTTNLPMTTADMLSVLTSAPLEYSYFDHGKLGAWAGPKHWRFKPLTRAQPEGEKVKGRKKKELTCLNYSQYEEEEEEEVLAQIERLMKLPKKAVKLVEKTMKGWTRDKSTLPEDLHYSGHELVRIKACDQMVVVGRGANRTETQVDDVEDYDYDNAADRDNYCPAAVMDDDNDGYDGDGGADDDLGGAEDNTLGSGETQGNSIFPASQDEYGGDNLVAAPKLVDKAALQIGYAKVAKKVDMKRIKQVAWSILTQASKEEKENVGASPEKQQLDKTQEKGTQEGGQVEEMQFSQVYKVLKAPHRLPAKMSENLSVSLAFLALLHLCNEQNLELTQDSSLQDFTIVQG